MTSLIEALKQESETKGHKCMVCSLPNAGEINEAFRIGRATGSWSIAQIHRELKKRGATMAVETLRGHFANHLKESGDEA